MIGMATHLSRKGSAMKKTSIILFSVACCCFVGCGREARQKADADADMEAIQKSIYEPHSSILAAGDLELWLSNFSEDVVYMPGNQPTLRGKNAVRQWAQEGFDRFSLKEDIKVEKIKVSGDLAFALFTYSFHATPKSEGKASHDDGRAMHILERQDGGSWKITYQISNRASPSEGT